MSAYHYTTVGRAHMILKSGELSPAIAHVPSDEVPVIWFSLQRTWEPTASKAVRDPRTGWLCTLTFPEMVKLGVARFRVDESILMPWQQLRVACRMSEDMAHALARVGRKQGANPRDWYGNIGALPLSFVEAVEYFRPTGWAATDHMAVDAGCVLAAARDTRKGAA